MRDTMAIDQYGDTHHSLGQHPRKALLDKLDRKHADKMYVDKMDGTVRHTGYVISGLWLTLYNVEAWEKAA